jgi:hypothetical protein
MPAPFNNINFPLSSLGYDSRVQTQVNSKKNYCFIAFKPGYPLQASELNEIQEQFYVQQTLTSEMSYNWGGTPYTGNPSKGSAGPGWQGATPLAPSLLSKSGTSIVLAAGWLFIKNSNFLGGLGVWIYNDTQYTFTVSSTSDNTYGLAVSSEVVTSTADTDLLDNSGGIRTIYGSNYAGADRIRPVLNTGTYTSNIGIPSGYYYLPIIKTVSISTGELTTGKIYTINNYEIT